MNQASEPTSDRWFILPTGALLYGDGTGGTTVVGLDHWTEGPERTAAIRALSEWCKQRALPVDEPTEADPPDGEHWFTLPTGALLYGDGTGGITVAGLAAWKDCPERTAAVHALSDWCKERALVGGRTAPLFDLGDFTAHSGARLGWKIECDALTDDDWRCLAAMAVEVLPPFGGVEGVPRGGMRFAEALAQHSVPGGALLIADDVCTTGASLEDHRDGRDAIGVVAFARGPVPAWVTPLLAVGGRSAAPTREQVFDAIADARPAGQIRFWPLHYSVAAGWIDSATDRVLDLLSRSAAEPPQQRSDAVNLRVLAAGIANGRPLEDGWPEVLRGIAERLFAAADDADNADGWVAAEPNEETESDGR